MNICELFFYPAGISKLFHSFRTRKPSFCRYQRSKNNLMVSRYVLLHFTKLPICGHEIGVRNSANHINERIRNTDLAPPKATQINKTRRPQRSWNTYKLYLKSIDSYTTLETFLLVEYVPFNRLHDCSGFKIVCPPCSRWLLVYRKLTMWPARTHTTALLKIIRSSCTFRNTSWADETREYYKLV